MEIKVQEFKRILKILCFLEILKISIRHQMPLCSHVKCLEELRGEGWVEYDRGNGRTRIYAMVTGARDFRW